jgi:hypothetical protein
MSCHTPILLGHESVIVPEIHCLYLAQKQDGSNEYYCTVYEKRFELAPWCKTSVEAIPLNALAWDCPYAQGVANFKGKRWAKDWERDAIYRVLREAFLQFGLPFADNPDSALKILNRNGEKGWTYRLEGDHYRFYKAGEGAESAASSQRTGSIDCAPSQDPLSL